MKTFALLAFCAVCLRAQTLDSLAFLEGNWEAKTQGGAANAASTGTYAFAKELGGHVMARHSRSADCKGPSNFDCDHHDLLYIYQDAAGQPLKAIYFDNEGHVIHYDVSVTSSTATFVSPQFRLIYERKGDVLSGKFQMRMPGQTEWTSYLEWSGPKR